MRLKILTGIQIFLIMAIIPVLFVPESFARNAIHLAITIIILSLIELLYIKRKNIEIILNNIEKIAVVILTILFILMLSIFDIINSGFLDINNLANIYPNLVAYLILIWAYLIFLPSIFIASGIVIINLVCFLLSDRTGGGYKKSTYKCCLIMIIFASIMYVFSTYPGIWIQDDVKSVWNDISNRNFRAWHTLGYELFVFLCSLIYPSTFSVNIVQMIVWILLNAYILKVLQEENGINMKIYTITLLIVAAPLNYLEVMYKDVVFSMGILAITVGLYHVVKNNKVIWQDILALALGGAVSSLCRHAGNIAVFLAFIAAIFYCAIKKRKKILKCFLGVMAFQVLVYLVVNVFLFQLLNVTENPAYIKYTMPMVTIGSAVSNGVEFDDADTEVLEMVMPVEEWGQCYDKYWADTISRSYGKIGDRIHIVSKLVDSEQYGLKLLKINLKLLLQHPCIYLKSIFDMNNIIWKIATPNDGYEWALCSVTKNEQITYHVPFVYTDLWTQFMWHNPFTNVVFARGGVALYIILLSGTIWIIKKKKHLLIALIPISIYDSMLFITIPAQDPRYILPGIECAIFLVAVVFGTDKETR